jgi:hypothetical protein
MLKIISAFGFAAMALMAHADEKTCAVKGMHCEACMEMVTGKVCDQNKYSTCDVKILDEYKAIGQIHLVTKDSTAKIDETAVGAGVKDAGYELQKCKVGKPAPVKKAKS